jgi:hypothetical protein
LFQLHKKPFHLLDVGARAVCRAAPDFSTSRSSPAGAAEADPVHSSAPARFEFRYARCGAWSASAGVSEGSWTATPAGALRRDRMPRPASSGRRAPPILRCSQWDW